MKSDSGKSDGSSALKAGCFTIFFGSVVVMLLTVLFFYAQDLFFPVFDPTFNPNILILAPCMLGAIFNSIPYIFAAYIVNIYKITRTGVLIMGVIAMGMSMFLSSYYGLTADLNQIKNINDLAGALVFCVSYYFPYYLAFAVYNLVVKKVAG